MFVTANQIQNGIIRYISQDMLPKLDGWKKVLFGASLELMSENELAKNIINSPYISMLGIKDANDMIDIDRLKAAIENQIGNQKMDIELPVIGVFRIGQGDLEKLCQIIKQGDEWQ